MVIQTKQILLVKLLQLPKMRLLRVLRGMRTYRKAFYVVHPLAQMLLLESCLSLKTGLFAGHHYSSACY
jgi:hypothetical protein